MSIASITLNGLEIGTGADFATGSGTLATLKGGIPNSPVLVDRPGNSHGPKFIRVQVGAKTIPIEIFILPFSIATRRTAFNLLVTATADGILVPLVYVEDGTTVTYQVSCSGPVPDQWYHKASIASVAPDPVPVLS